MLVQTVALPALTAAPPGGAGAGPSVGMPPVELGTRPSDDWLAIAAGRKGGLPDAAWHVLTAVDQVRFAHVYADGALVAVGRGAPSPAGGAGSGSA